VSRHLIQAQELSKRYLLYARPEDRLKQALFWRFGRTYGRDFWALRNVTFSVEQGESVGVIGRNGSGKSTLLQLIAGTLQPTTGSVQVHGRVAALLELGSGFNPEYTGKENVYLNAAILGLSREQTNHHFEEIVDFAEIGGFVDQPVKLYSSGMMMRLAFAVQAIVPSDILIVDEALAVGDEAFQRKCFNRLERFRSNGGTVLLVSHSAQAIIRHCQRCLFLHEGELVIDGPSRRVTDMYQRIIYSPPLHQIELLNKLRASGSDWLSAAEAPASEAPATDYIFVADSSDPQLPSSKSANTFSPDLSAAREIAYGNGSATIIDPHMEDQDGRQVNVLVAGERYVWTYLVDFQERAENVNFGMMVRTIDGQVVAAINTELLGHYFDRMEANSMFRIAFTVTMNIAQGTYFVEAGVVGATATPAGDGGFLHRRMDTYTIRVLPPSGSPVYGIAFLNPSAVVAPSEAQGVSR
jgi:lipopolysaccharide transport system ATP-binding protein